VRIRKQQRQQIRFSGPRAPRAGSTAAFTLIETMVAFFILAIVVFSLYAALSFGFTTIRLAQENVRADQILTEKMETIRVYHWSKVFTPGYLPQTFQASYSQSGGTNLYNGFIAVTSFPASAANESYADSLRQVTITVNWVSGGMSRSRSLTSFVSQYGLQTYKN
jgi:type II secretory pathway pseudopilin PulG